MPTGGRSSAAGSSPRVRGKPPPLPLHRRPHRLIPARAGKTKRESSTPRSRRAHPRACGENYAPMIAALGSAGSSPRVRGKLEASAGLDMVARLIPACAGKTQALRGPPLRPPAHPRVCGENHALLVNDPNALGSSPRVRGKPGFPQKSRSPGGLIPACAGKTVGDGVDRDGDGAHPRVCGENEGVTMHALRHAGSSPRVRGKHGHRGQGQPRRRLIPACAGKTTRPSPCAPRTRAHPRVCGENGSRPAL